MCVVYERCEIIKDQSSKISPTRDHLVNQPLLGWGGVPTSFGSYWY